MYKDHLNQRSDFKEAKQTRKRVYQEFFSNHWKWKQTYPSRAVSPTKGAINSSKALKNMHIDLMLLQDGDTILLPQRIRLHDGNQASTCGQRGTGTRGNLHPGVNNDFFKKSFQMSVFFDFACRKCNRLAIHGRSGVNSTLSAHTLFSCPFCQRACPQPVVIVVQVHTATQSRTDPTHSRGSRNQGAHCLCLAPKTVTLHRAMSYVTPHLTTPSTCTPSLSSTLSSSPALHPRRA